ncbi:MAG: BtaA family protein [Bacteroidota bacterium]
MLRFFYDHWFRLIHNHLLIYNTCWEDSRIDRNLLQLNRDSTVLVITSAGENALHYLQDDPKWVHTVDINPRQNALLELKKALIQTDSFEGLTALFTEGKHPEYRTIYQKVRTHLPRYALTYWDRRIEVFSPSGPGLYFSGGAGRFAKTLHRLFKIAGVYDHVDRLFDEQDMETRRRLFETIFDRLMRSKKSGWMLNTLTFGFSGVPPQQLNAIHDVPSYLYRCLYPLFVTQRAADNHFWRLYWKGSYSASVRPDYLFPDTFSHIKARLDCLSISTETITQHLKRTPRTYSHIVLLDQQDWMLNDQEAFRAQWEAILARTEPGSKILFRSVCVDREFLPELASNALYFDDDSVLGLIHEDRVHTYASTHLGIVR